MKINEPNQSEQSSVPSFPGNRRRNHSERFSAIILSEPLFARKLKEGRDKGVRKLEAKEGEKRGTSTGKFWQGNFFLLCIILMCPFHANDFRGRSLKGNRTRTDNFLFRFRTPALRTKGTLSL